MNIRKGYSKMWFLALLLVAFVAGCASNAQEIPINPIGPDTVAPTVTVTSPTNTAVSVPINRKINVAFSEAMDPATIITASFTVKETVNGKIVPGTVTPVGTTVTFAPLNLFALNTSYTVTIKGGIGGVKDLAGNLMASNFVFSFKTGGVLDNIAPTVSVTSPTAGAVAVPLNRQVHVGFSEEMDSTTISSTSFIMKETVLGNIVLGTVTPVGTSVAFVPSNLLKSNTNYTCTIKGGIGGVKDLAGNPMASDFVFSFQTSAVLDNIAPTVIFVNPADLATGVATSSSVNATFSKEMAPATIIAAGAFTVTDPSLALVPGTVTPAGTSAVTFTPSNPLALNTKYIVTIKGGIGGVADLSTNVMVSNFVFSFTTGVVNPIPPGPVVNLLKTASTFGIMAVDSITNTGVKTHIFGDVSLQPGTSIGLLAAQVTGTIHVNDAVSNQASLDLKAAYLDLSTRAATTTFPVGVTNLSGMVLTTGVYSVGVPLSDTYSLDFSKGALVLDAQGDPNAVFIFQASDITTTTGSVVLRNGAQAKNIFWVPIHTATIGAGTFFQGTIVAGGTITLAADANVEGRMLAGALGAGAITLSDNIVTVPAP